MFGMRNRHDWTFGFRVVGLGCQQGIKRRSVTPKIAPISRRIAANVKMVPNARFQGLVPGEMELEDFPFRLLKSRK